MDNITKQIVARVKQHRNMPANTCPASRHAEMIGDHLVRKKPYAMLTEEPEHCGGSILSTVASLYEARTEIERLQALINEMAGCCEHVDHHMAPCVCLRKLDAHQSLPQEKS